MTILSLIFQKFILFYFIALTVGYIMLDILALIYTTRYLRRHRVDYELPKYFSGYEPSVSILVPAFNEEKTVVATTHALLQLLYPSFEIIIINDGSTDSTLDVLKKEFDLNLSPEIYEERLETNPVNAIYHSTFYRRLRVIDKEKGGKGDALNAGLNLSRSTLVASIDSDSVLSRESLLRVVRPFVDDPTTIAGGGQVRILNGCELKTGHVVESKLPRNMWALIQVVEYLRAFLFGRLGWSPLNALLLISGAFGVFNREILVEAGGYRTDTVGEDMELVLRLHKLMRTKKRKYRISFVPDPICWTEAPEGYRALASQRVRWQRGLGESIGGNISLLFNFRGGTVGWLAMPFNILFELFGPLLEVGGVIFIILAYFLKFLSLKALVVFLLVAFGSGLLLSINAILMEELTFHVYKDMGSIFVLLASAFMETPLYRLLNSLWRIKGLMLWMFGRKRTWGRTDRKGTKRPAAPQPLPQESAPVAAQS